MTKILLLILSSDTNEIYRGFQECWRNYMKSHKEIDYYFYKCDPSLPTDFEIRDDVIYVKCKDGLNHLFTKFILALRAVEEKLDDYDFICRPNESSFVIFPNYIQHLCTFPKVQSCVAIFTNYFKIVHPSGALFALSSDVAQKMALLPCEECYVDDVQIGYYLQKLGVHYYPSSRLDLDIQTGSLEDIVQKIKKNTIFHVRCKTKDRRYDVEMFRSMSKYFQ